MVCAWTHQGVGHKDPALTEISKVGDREEGGQRTRRPLHNP